MFFGFDLNVILLALVVLTGGVWLIYLLFASKASKKVAKSEPPWWLDYSRSSFPILLVIFIFRAFLFEPYQIPSGSMLPSLRAGDFILVNKFTYGVRFPLNNLRLTQGRSPKPGDVIVFDFPPDPRVRYIKRLIGMPGDRVVYQDKSLTINNQSLAYFRDENAGPNVAQEYLDNNKNREPHKILVDPVLLGGEGEWVVPAEHYFVMGDNRDNSNDSRYWGFVPHKYLVGKAIYVWMHWASWKQLPSFHRNQPIH